MTVLKIEHLHNGYREKDILNDINLTIEEGEIFGLIGLNGAGKTTLIKSVLGLLTPTSGYIDICGMNTKNRHSRKNVSYLPEKFQPNQQLKCKEFIKIFSDSFDLEKVKELCETLDLDKSVLNKKISSLSKGMSQKIGLITAVLNNKNLMILDEPMSGLDPKARINLKNLLLNYKKNGKSVFFSSHILSDIDEICDRIAILNNNKIVFIGTPEELKAKNNNTSLEKAFLSEIA